VYDRFQLVTKFHAQSRVTIEKSSSSCRTSSDLTLGSRTNHSQLLKFWPRRHSAITPLRLLTRSPPGPRLTPEGRILRSRWVLSRWCRLAISVARPMRMPVLISSSSWNSIVPLLSRNYLRMRSSSICSRYLFWRE